MDNVVRVSFKGLVKDGKYCKDEAVVNILPGESLEPGNLVVCDMHEYNYRLGHVLSVWPAEEVSQVAEGWIVQKVDTAGYKETRKAMELDDLLGL
ncbi:MAG: hypothetical protein H6Q67_1494 [Firmicutes bacterium]|nr:hypothetical protein [Bacillota bacterium]